MRIIIAAALALVLGLAPALAQKINGRSGESDGNADVLNSLMLKASDRCYGLSGGERSACCQRYFDNLCGGEIAATAPPVVPVAAPAPAISSASPRPPSAPSRSAVGGDGPADVLNGFVMKEVAQCRPLPAYERRACCEKLLHPNACVE